MNNKIIKYLSRIPLKDEGDKNYVEIQLKKIIKTIL